MPQRQYRPGDVLDDYCPRERRVTDHAIVAMVEGEVQRTRCVVCDAEHEFRNARVPAPRRKSATAALFTQVLDHLDAGPGRLAGPPAAAALPGVAPPVAAADSAAAEPAGPPPASGPAATDPGADDRPFRRSLIRAQLPRPEGQLPPARAIPEFTMHQPLHQRHGRGPARFRRRPGTGADVAGPRGGRDAGVGQGQGHAKGRRRRRKKR